MEFNLGTLVVTSIASFLVGMAASTIMMLYSFSNKLVEFRTKLDLMAAQLDKHVGAPTIICGYHQTLEKELQELKTQTAINTKDISDRQG